MTALTVLMHGRSFGSSDQHWGEKQIWEQIYNDSFEELYRKIVFKCWIMQIKLALYNFMICASDKQETNKKLFQRQNYKASSWRFEPNVKIVKMTPFTKKLLRFLTDFDDKARELLIF